MKRNSTLALVFIAVLAFPAPVFAEHADAPSRHAMRRVRNLSQQLEREAGELLRLVDRRHHGGHRGRERTLEKIEQFERSADRFAHDVARNMWRPENTVDSYRSMKRKHREMAEAIENGRARPPVRAKAEHIGSLVQDISQFYRRSEGSRVDWKRLEYMSRQIEYLARRVHERAHRELSRRGGVQYDWHARETLDRLHDLSEVARQFRREVEKGRRDLSKVRVDYEDLYEAQQRAAGRIWNLEYQTRMDFYRMTDLIRDFGGRCSFGEPRRDYVDRDDRHRHGGRHEDGRYRNRSDGQWERSRSRSEPASGRSRERSREDQLTNLIFSIFRNELN